MPALKPRKASRAFECEMLEQLPNIGPSLAGDLRRIGIEAPQDLVGRDALSLYRDLCTQAGKRPDPCVLDTFMAAIDFMTSNGPAMPWWHFTAKRKALYGIV